MMSSGHFALLPFMRRAFDKLVLIIDQEMQAIGAQKVLLPSVYSTKFLHISERLEQFKGEVYMFDDKTGNPHYLAPVSIGE
jgi:prolyl-tRNA synthetase